MHIHILGIGGTFMGGIAALAQSQGIRVSGCDQNIYPPMSTQLQALGIEVTSGYDNEVPSDIDCFVIGNAISRGNPLLEKILNRNLNFTSGPEWLKQHILKDKHVVAVSGTHGKTTTTSMLAWILEDCGEKPSFLIGGVPSFYSSSARLQDSKWFVIEADEYDTAFFDKRAKFVHYKPQTLIINNIEFDHADIYEDLSAIQKQFHHLVRIIPQSGKILVNAFDENIQGVLAMGCWSDVKMLGPTGDWSAKLLKQDGSEFTLEHKGKTLGTVQWQCFGRHNVANALAALAACIENGVCADKAIEALSSFENTKRRQELLLDHDGTRLWDDFAHHPTAIDETLNALQQRSPDKPTLAIVDLGSNTMKMGVHQHSLAASLRHAQDAILLHDVNLNWSVESIATELNQKGKKVRCCSDVETLLKTTKEWLKPGTQVVILSNRGIEPIKQGLSAQIKLLSSSEL